MLFILRPERGSLLALFVFIQDTGAYTSFQPTCTIPNSTVNFVASPGMRGSLDILWSCLFTILACTWSIQHLNIPEQRDRSKEIHKGWWSGIWYDMVWSGKRLWTGFKWMVATILAPELILGKAIGDLKVARDLTQRLRERAQEDGVEWNLVHSFFLLMGGFHVVRVDASEDGITAPTFKDRESLNAQAGRDSAARQSVTDTPHPPRLKTESERLANLPGIVVLTPRRAMQLVWCNLLPRLPNIRAEEIKDKSKSSWFVKVVAAVQVAWVTAQVVVRTTRGLPVSQLELVVAAFSACAVLTYLVLIPKPQGVEVAGAPIPIQSSQWEGVLEVCRYDFSGFHLRTIFLPGVPVESVLAFSHEGHATIPNDLIAVLWHPHTLGYALGFSTGGILFGAIHVAGWNFEFPTTLEQTIWRVSSVLIIALLPPSLLPIFLHNIGKDFHLHEEDPKRVRITQLLALVCGIAYTVARLALLVVTFRSLAYMPPQAFVSTWAENVPHFG